MGERSAETGSQAQWRLGGSIKDSEPDRGKVNPLNGAVSVKHAPASFKMMYFWRKLSSAVFWYALSCMSGADASHIPREAFVKVAEILLFQQNDLLTMTGLFFPTRKCETVHCYYCNKEKIYKSRQYDGKKRKKEKEKNTVQYVCQINRSLWLKVMERLGKRQSERERERRLWCGRLSNLSWKWAHWMTRRIEMHLWLKWNCCILVSRVISPLSQMSISSVGPFVPFRPQEYTTH